MLYILLSILSSAAVLMIFKLLQRVGARSRQTIMLSYAVSALASVVVFSPSLKSFVTPWFVFAAVEGMTFYAVFRWMALTTEVNGISVASIASKMSVVIPILIGILILGERANALMVAGMLCGLVAVILSSASSGKAKSSNLKWPLLVFLGTGLIDASFKLFQIQGLTEAAFPGFMITIFSFAFLTGFVHHLSQESRFVNRSSIVMAGFLGIANLATVYFILLALAVPTLESSVVYALNNFGIVFASSLIAVFFFAEKLKLKGWLGPLFAALAIAFLFLGA